jgi:hypothetical protein
MRLLGMFGIVLVPGAVSDTNDSKPDPANYTAALPREPSNDERRE